ncbi:four helix bundle protein [Flagellimonas olearia]|uniref:Four helix bundle protein n=1 Tax=Flagellimonas olearia TaxID=552546 RepID=A0A6I1DX52_9FLAO|nr:four helix bundle protein [Allomuricauda olearia]KAB7530023.1 four helix bundle protein [Allomuricauda olearia]
MKKENTIQSKSFDFALGIVRLTKRLEKDNKEFVLSKQLLRSGTAIGALIREAEHAESKKDFIHKMSISLKEANETRYWLDLLMASDFIEKPVHKILNDEITQIIRLLASIVKSSKQNI